MTSKLNCGVCVMPANMKPTSIKNIGMNSTRLPESSGLKGVIGRMSNAPELELIYGALAEIDKKLGKIDEVLRELIYPVLSEIAVKYEDTNNELKKLNEILETYLSGIHRRMWEVSP